jgi:hypothetical protein
MLVKEKFYLCLYKSIVMKKIIILFIFLVSIINSYSQIVNIPDPNFLQALTDENVDTNNDGQIQLSEVQAKTSLYFSSKNFASMEGINSFTNLQRLDCHSNSLLTEINIAGLSKLSIFDFSNNSLLTTVNIFDVNSMNTLTVYNSASFNTMNIVNSNT